jgi:hypothetical protein
MAVSNELSSDIATAIWLKTRPPQELDRLKKIVLQVDSTLQKMSNEARTDSASEAKPPKTAAS